MAATPFDHYRNIYVQTFVELTVNLRDRFDQPDFGTYKQSEDLLLKAANGHSHTDELESVLSVYGDDIDRQKLVAQLAILQSEFKGEHVKCLNDIVEFLKVQTAPMQALFSEIVTLTRLLLVMPATNAVSERSFSAMRVIKNYLRTNASQNRLNHTMLLFVHKDLTDKLDVLKVAQQFVDKCGRRQDIFGKFSPLDLGGTLIAAKSKATQTE